MQLPVGKLVELRVVDSISTVTSVVLDHLNTHPPAALYATFPPAEACWILRRLDSHYIPKHGSWLNMAEIEFAVVSTQCLDRRLRGQETGRREIAAWETRRNEQIVTDDWRLTTAKARCKLKGL